MPAMNGDISSILPRLMEETEAWPGFTQAMLAMLLGENPASVEESPLPKKHSWWDLPGACCEAAGGNWSDAQPFAVAWGLLYAAAHILDDVEDEDPRLRIPQNAAINAATGLYASSGIILTQLADSGLSDAASIQLLKDVQNTILKMCSAQHTEFCTHELSLEECWRIAEAKSGAFFALACRTGAQLANADADCINAFSRFGHHVGLLIQLGNDLLDVSDSTRRKPVSKISFASLPVGYTLSIADPATCEQLSRAVQFSAGSIKASERAKRIMSQEGAILFLMANLEKQRIEATNALQDAAPFSSAFEILLNMVNETAPMK